MFTCVSSPSDTAIIVCKNLDIAIIVCKNPLQTNTLLQKKILIKIMLLTVWFQVSTIFFISMQMVREKEGILACDSRNLEDSHLQLFEDNNYSRKKKGGVREIISFGKRMMII